MFLPEYVKRILGTLHEHGFPAYVVGGCVRDGLMGRTPKDYDVTTAALPADIQRIFPRTALTGEKYGTVTVLEDQPVEVTTFRVDGTYRDGRRPETVRFTSRVEDDLARRDLTINAIAFHEQGGYIDPFGGRADIEAGRIRTVGEPEKRFSEDALRILRVFRFSCELGFTIEPRTREACFAGKDLLSKVSVERITIELYKALMGEHADHLLPLLQAGGLSHLGFQKPRGPFLLSALPRELCCRLAALLHVCGEGNEQEILTNLRTDKCTKRMVGHMLILLNQDALCTPAEIKRHFRFIPPESFADFLRTYEKVNHVPMERSLAVVKQILEKKEAWNISMLDIGGEELIGMGIPKGKPVGETLEFLLCCVLERPEINSKEILQMIAREYMDKVLSDPA